MIRRKISLRIISKTSGLVNIYCFSNDAVGKNSLAVSGYIKATIVRHRISSDVGQRARNAKVRLEFINGQASAFA